VTSPLITMPAPNRTGPCSSSSSSSSSKVFS
jgi:hypothetical protein